MDPVGSLVVELPVGVNVALLQTVVSAHAEVDGYKVALLIGKMITRAGRTDRISVEGKDRTRNIVTSAHLFQRGSIGRENRAELRMAIFARCRVHTRHSK